MKDKGPLKGISIDINSLVREYHRAMGWDPETGSPADETLEKMGLKELIQKHG